MSLGSVQRFIPARTKSFLKPSDLACTLPYVNSCGRGCVPTTIQSAEESLQTT
jgi:hypothetical protein